LIISRTEFFQYYSYQISDKIFLSAGSSAFLAAAKNATINLTRQPQKIAGPW